MKLIGRSAFTRIQCRSQLSSNPVVEKVTKTANLVPRKHCEAYGFTETMKYVSFSLIKVLLYPKLGYNRTDLPN